MTDAKASEPSIEEILASIRKIISDDEPEEPAEIQAAAPPVEDEDEILELTDIVQETPEPSSPPMESPSMTDEPPQDHPLPEELRHEDARQEEIREPRHEDTGESIISDATLVAATGAFAKLSHPDSSIVEAPTARGQTVEDIARDLLRPILRQWIDQNLPGIVERLVERELRKISRKAEDL